MKKEVNKVQSLGNLYVLTKTSVEKANQMIAKEKEERRNRNILKNQNRINNEEKAQENNQDNIIDKMAEIKEILTKSGLSKFFPFKPERNKEGEIVGFVPKGKNNEEIKKDIEEYKVKMQEALEKGKIDEEEVEKLEENLDDLMKENNIELEEKEENKLEVTDKEIMDNIKGFIMHNYGDKGQFEKEQEKFENMDLDERKFKLQDINSKVNTQLGIEGNLKFSSNPNLKFGDSFVNGQPGGYYLTEKEVQEKGLGPALYTMMEKSLMRQKEQQMKQQISPQEKERMHKKILDEKKRREEYQRKTQEQEKRTKDKQDKKNHEQARQRMRNWNG